MRTYATRNDLTKLQLAKLERDDPAAYLEYAAKKAKAKAGAKKEKGDKNNPKCSTGNYQCRGKKGVACIPKSKGCNYDLSNVPPERKAYIEAAVEGLKAEGAKPKTARIGRKLGAPIVELTPEQYGKALEMNISQLKLMRGDATREQLREIGVDVDGVTSKPGSESPQSGQAQKNKSDLRQALEREGLEFNGIAYKGQELSDAIDRLADRLERNALEIRDRSPEKSQAADTTLARRMEYVKSLRDGQVTDFDTTQRLVREIEGGGDLSKPPESQAEPRENNADQDSRGGAVDTTKTKSGRPIPERVQSWMSKPPAWDLPKWLASDPVANLLVRAKGETLSSVVFNGMTQAATVTRLNPPSSKYPDGSISLSSNEPNGGKAVLNFITLRSLLSSDGVGVQLPADPFSHSFSEPSSWQF
jgi:hypothetical protein